MPCGALGNLNLIASSPSGPQPGNRASVRPEKNRPRKKPLTQEKNKYPLSTELASVWPEKNKCPKEKKRGQPGGQSGKKAFWASPEGFFSSGQAAHPGSAQEIVRPSVRKKTGPEKQTADARKTNPHLFFQASVGRQTSNQIHVP